MVDKNGGETLRRLILLLSFIVFLYASWGVLEKQYNKIENHSLLETIKTEIDMLKDNPKVSYTVSSITLTLNNLFQQLERFKENQIQQNESIPVPKPHLVTPTEQIFAIHNIQIGDSKKNVEEQLGKPKRSTMNEFGIHWNTYHENYQHFMMVGYDENQFVVGLYTNQDLITSMENIKYGSNKEQVSEKLGLPLTKIKKGLIYYQFDEEKDYEIYLLNDSYVTIFYDEHQENKVTAIQIISKSLEDSRMDFYTASSSDLKVGFETQLFDLTNATRVNHGLDILIWDDLVRETARKHSQDMAQNSYFSHTNLEGQSPFDRMHEDNIIFSMAGENLAYGQFSSIYAHEGLMNSLGHRKNIIQAEFRYLGVGVAFNDQSHPYYTEKFFTK